MGTALSGDESIPDVIAGVHRSAEVNFKEDNTMGNNAVEPENGDEDNEASGVPFTLKPDAVNAPLLIKKTPDEIGEAFSNEFSSTTTVADVVSTAVVRRGWTNVVSPFIKTKSRTEVFLTLLSARISFPLMVIVVTPVIVY